MNAEIPCGPVYNMGGVFNDRHIAGLNMRHPVTHKTLKSFDIVAQPVKMSRSQARTGMPAPERGEHTSQILEGIGLTPEDIKTLQADGVI